MAYISLEARHQTASPRRRIRWERVAIVGASLGLWAGVIALATALS
ncbi:MULTISPECIES: hypothetical protein [unclassified Caulobacter]|nr:MULTISPECIES: hypothetical protein [unclassified Caulobacter]